MVNLLGTTTSYGNMTGYRVLLVSDTLLNCNDHDFKLPKGFTIDKWLETTLLEWFLIYDKLVIF